MDILTSRSTIQTLVKLYKTLIHVAINGSLHPLIMFHLGLMFGFGLAKGDSKWSVLLAPRGRLERAQQKLESWASQNRSNLRRDLTGVLAAGWGVAWGVGRGWGMTAMGSAQ